MLSSMSVMTSPTERPDTEQSYVAKVSRFHSVQHFSTAHDESFLSLFLQAYQDTTGASVAAMSSLNMTFPSEATTLKHAIMEEI